MEKESLPDRLRQAREQLGISKAEASRRLNLSKIGYCRYEYGERIPSPQTLEIIAQCFNTSVDYLTGKTDNMSPDMIVVSKKSRPKLYELTIEASAQNEATCDRLLTYLSEITNNKKTRETD